MDFGCPERQCVQMKIHLSNNRHTNSGFVTITLILIVINSIIFLVIIIISIISISSSYLSSSDDDDVYSNDDGNDSNDDENGFHDDCGDDDNNGSDDEGDGMMVVVMTIMMMVTMMVRRKMLVMVILHCILFCNVVCQRLILTYPEEKELCEQNSHSSGIYKNMQMYLRKSQSIISTLDVHILALQTIVATWCLYRLYVMCGS